MNKLFFTLGLFLCMVISVNCPNDCSGHGVCGLNRKCYCNKQLGLGLNKANYEEEYYTGSDCSKRMCPKGPSHPYVNTNPFWWKEDNNAYYFERYNQTQAYKVASAEYFVSGGDSMLLALSDISALDLYKAGGHFSCFLDQEMTKFYSTYMINAIDRYALTTPVLYGIQMYPKTVSEEEKANDETQYIWCRVTYLRQDYSLYGLWPINDYNSKGEYREEVNLFVPNQFDVYKDNYLGILSLIINNFIVYDVSLVRKVTFVCTDYDGKMKEFQTDFVIENYNIRIKTVHSLGQCFMLYSIMNGALSLEKSELLNFIGEEGEFGKLLKNSVMLWANSSTLLEDNNNNNNLYFNISLQLKSFDMNDLFTIRETSVGEIKDIISVGGTAILYEYTLNDEETFYPIRMQTLHISNYEFAEDFDNEIVSIEFYEPITIVNEDILSDNSNNNNNNGDDTTGTDAVVDDSTTEEDIERDVLGAGKDRVIYGLQIFQEGPHSAVECSGVGECNRETGKCECPVGFQGSACQRTSCPNNCSGKGKCLPYLNSDSIYGNEVLYHCVCDGGFRGSDCSKFECPSREDPKKATNMKAGDEFRDCSGRGICDYESGICSCFDGFSGEACDKIVSMY